MSHVIDGILAIVTGLPANEKRQLVDRLVSSGVLTEGCEDALVMASRRNEPATPYRQFRRRLQRRGLLR
jgi:hypothetical protein